MTLFHVGCVSCWVTLWGICGSQCNEGPRSRCFTLGLWFHVGFRADLVMFFMLFRVGFMSVMLGWCIEMRCFENGRTPQVSLRFRPRRGLSKIRCFMSGWGFVSCLRVPKIFQQISWDFPGICLWNPRTDPGNSHSLLEFSECCRGGRGWGSFFLVHSGLGGTD